MSVTVNSFDFLKSVGWVLQVRSLTPLYIRPDDTFVMNNSTRTVIVKMLESNDGCDNLKPYYCHPVICPLNIGFEKPEFEIKAGDVLNKLCRCAGANEVTIQYDKYDFCSESCVARYKDSQRNQIHRTIQQIDNQIIQLTEQREQYVKELNSSV